MLGGRESVSGGGQMQKVWGGFDCGPGGVEIHPAESNTLEYSLR